MTSTILVWNRAPNIAESLRAVEKWHQLKSVIVGPSWEEGVEALPYGRITYNMDQWHVGDLEECWTNTFEQESGRRKKK